MKTTAILFMLTIICTTVFGQTDKSKRPSPPDSVKVTTNDGVTIDIHYSRPSLKGRQIGVDIVKIGEVWRTGANEATTVAFDKDVLVEGKKLSKGKYSLYTIPGEQETIVIFNKTWDQWGTKYDKNQDALRVNVSSQTNNLAQEQFKIDVDQSGKIGLLWGDYVLPIQVKSAL
ncbi:hypothetical protein D3C87_1419730 [compost metagenome]|uniref:DUF2911 domain-containing protein n=1 Tax=Sphingobacterium faecium TaxID=34087 RepID=UPI000D383170|nr:DUF2911 domain-containing protein [Sphingobacterium faecium]PTX12842.1 Protein of unknown function (DUF2911) [Sphingobacterium faecium]GEM62543.1 hypothetical protein SF1_05250 [Sphingobacterium faecium NBRC 15299]